MPACRRDTLATLPATERPCFIGADELKGLPNTVLAAIENKVQFGEPVPRIGVRILGQDSIDNRKAYLFRIHQGSRDG